MSDAIASLQLKPGIYRHYKGTEYRVFGTALYTDYPICFVLYGKDQIEWARPYSDFVEMVEVDGEDVPRFEFLRD